jgi:integrase
MIAPLRNSYHETIYVQTIQHPGRVTPLVLLENGKPGYAINTYINYLMMQGEQEATLRQKISAVCQLYEFCKRFYGDRDLTETELRHLVFEFGSAKLHGTVQPDGSDPTNLFWAPIRPSTVRLLIRHIDAFDKFQETFFHAKRLNPVEVRFQTAFERYQDFRRRQKYDPFIHLFTARTHTTATPRYAVKEHHRTKQRRPQKAFPIDHVIDLISKTAEPRDRMLLLLMAFGGLRRSEPLHVLHHDVIGRFADTGAAWIRLADPVTGTLRWSDANGVERNGDRATFFRDEFRNEFLPKTHPLRNLQPRCLYGRQGHGLQAGFKGMTFSGHDDNNFVHWLHEEAGCLFWTAYQEYLERHFFGKPKHWPYHPFLFIRLDPAGFGMPLSIPGVDKVFARAAARVGVTGYSPHALRHFYGYYTASVLRRPIEEAQVCMHHASVLSTQVYYKTDPLVVRSELMAAASGGGSAQPLSYGRLTLPAIWRCNDINPLDLSRR